MRDIIKFPVLGSKYQHKALDKIKELVIGDTLELIREPNNPIDPNAISISFDGVKIGYVPNKGYSCSNCWSSVKLKDYFCSKCQADSSYFIEGGLAVRLIRSGFLQSNNFCFVEEIRLDSEDTPLFVNIVNLDSVY